MTTDLKHPSTETDVETAFQQLDEHRRTIAEIEQPFDHQIKEIDDEIDQMIEALMTQRKELEDTKANETTTHTEAIDVLTQDIKEMVIENKKSCSTIYGTCTFVNGREGAVKWNDDALNGAIAGNEDLNFLLGFRSEKSAGKPSTRFKLVELTKED